MKEDRSRPIKIWLMTIAGDNFDTSNDEREMAQETLLYINFLESAVQRFEGAYLAADKAMERFTRTDKD